MKKRKYQNYYKYDGELDPWDGGSTPSGILHLIDQPAFQSSDRTTKLDMLRRILREHDDSRDAHEHSARLMESRCVPLLERSRRRYNENVLNVDRYTSYGTSEPLLPTPEELRQQENVRNSPFNKVMDRLVREK